MFGCSSVATYDTSKLVRAQTIISMSALVRPRLAGKEGIVAFVSAILRQLLAASMHPPPQSDNFQEALQPKVSCLDWPWAHPKTSLGSLQ